MAIRVGEERININPNTSPTKPVLQEGKFDGVTGYDLRRKDQPGDVDVAVPYLNNVQGRSTRNLDAD